MLQNRNNLSDVLAKYPMDCQPIGIAAWSGGFSGSRIWRLETASGPLCLRRWADSHPNSTQLRQIHSVLNAVRATGFELMPVPIEARDQSTFVEHSGWLWELTQWMPGAPFGFAGADDASCRPRIAAAMEALARFHRAVDASREIQISSAPPPGILRRLELFNALLAGELDQLTIKITMNDAYWPELAVRAPAFIDAFRKAAPRIHRLLEGGASQLRVPVSPCIRDIHRGHVLFTNDAVTGLIDYGAMQPDSVAADIARLLGSAALNRAELWLRGLESFQHIRPLSNDECFLVRIYDETGVLLSGINWLRWAFDERREFNDRAAVLARFDEISGRLRYLSESGLRTGFPD
jgi:Ser/Thr protein kinase RdoA (MazF antagonist)